ncbi:Rpn family recombination-promoting nuclease/putative transposase [Chromatium okenii]|uniref:Rpn family recombination-promoting nuclease/putative transposase n=1 Tax=Chromatium okenii TaxID=61644 RepID=UPI0026EADB6F|nr:Rpn family recombination-promoting nuclease/putative transposase [Chromatium okenii]MBV5308645.1 Rpn family recombination-promoting nuclease/putative transposase [Chromatium okenii]
MQHDSGYKLLFSHAQMVEDLLRGFITDDWVNHLDFTTLEKVNTNQITDDLRERHNDLIWRVRWHSPAAPPRWLYLYLLLEFQSLVDHWMAVRIFTYIGLLYQDLIRQGQIKKHEKLPPVLPIVLYNGNKTWTAPVNLAALVEQVQGLEPYCPQMRYFLLDEQHYDETQLLELGGLSAALFRLERSRTAEAMMDVLSQLNHWLNTPGNEALHHAFTEFLRLVLLPARLPGIELPIMHELSEVRAMLSERVKEWTQQWEQQGLLRGRLEGRREGLNAERFLLARQAKRRFGAAIAAQFELSIAIIDDSEQLSLIGEWLIDCNTGKELLQQVEQFVKQAPTK